MLLEKFGAVKYYLDSYLVKGFIQAYSALYLSPVFFVKKSNKKIWFCVNYQRLNTIIKKNHHLIALIKETLVQLKVALRPYIDRKERANQLT